MSGHERERLGAYLDGELFPGERAEVEAHLAACPECKSLLSDTTAVDAAAASLPAEAPEGYFDAFPSRVVARLGAVSRAPTRTRRLPAWTWAAAAALLLAVVAPLTLRQRAPSLVPATTQAPGAPRPASEDRKPEPDALATPDATPVLATPPKPAFAARPTAVLPATPGGPAAAETRSPLAPPAAKAEDVASRAKRTDAPAQGGVREEPAPVTTEAFAATEGAPRPERRAPTVAAAPMASSAREEEAAAGAVSAAEPQLSLGRLEAARPRTAAEWRRLRDSWNAFAAARPDDPRADGARVRAIEAGREAWLAGGADDDQAAFLRDARAYLEREDALQKERVERLLGPPQRP